MKVILYIVILGLSGIIIHLLGLMVSRPFSSSNMQSSYTYGCNIGYNKPLTKESILRCENLAEIYLNALENEEAR